MFTRFDAEPLSHAILGLHQEVGGTAAACTLRIDLIEHYVDRLAASTVGDDRLRAAWAAVRCGASRARRDGSATSPPSSA